VAGYYFGQALETILGNVKHYEMALAGTIISIASVLWLVRFYRQRRAANKYNPPDVS
jgi:membrane protein DedA with SNARE-associated domain